MYSITATMYRLTWNSTLNPKISCNPEKCTNMQISESESCCVLTANNKNIELNIQHSKFFEISKFTNEQNSEHLLGITRLLNYIRTSIYVAIQQLLN